MRGCTGEGLFAATGPAAGMAALLVLVACATTYQPLGMGGGYSETRLARDRYLVSFEGNEHTSRETVQAYLLNRCAELTEEGGFAYFLIVEGGVGGSTTTIQTPGEYHSTTIYQGRRGVATSSTYSTYTPGQTIPVTRYGGTVTIQMFPEGQKPDDPKAYNARELLESLAPRIKR